MRKQRENDILYRNYKKEDLERKSLQILSEYEDGKMLLSPGALDVDHFAEFYLRLTIDFANLSSDGLTLGCMCFDDGNIEVWDEYREKCKYIKTQKGTLYIDAQALASSPKERTNFTIMHECSHWILHRRFYFEQKLVKNRIPVYKSDSIKARMTDDEIKEWQADYLAGSLLMPKPMVIQYLEVTLGYESADNLKVKQHIVDELSKVFKVSKTAMKVRLKNLSIEVM